ncbi:MAG: DNA repair helicase XPB [Planctomycetota bacterium]|jgi:DNA excision repair protein ERCC-3
MNGLNMNNDGQLKPQEKPLIVQSDRTILLEVDNPRFAEARDTLSLFAELEKSPEHIHTYRITPLSIWNAAAAGFGEEEIVTFLNRMSRYQVPPNVDRDIRENIRKFGLLSLVKRDDRLLLISEDHKLIRELWANSFIKKYLVEKDGEGVLVVKDRMRGDIKQALIKIGLPVEDMAGYVDGAPYDFEILDVTREDQPFMIRQYQREAAAVFYAGGSARGGSGVIVLPCGAGKTIVGIDVMSMLKTHALILTTNTIAVRQWQQELKDKTDINKEDIGEYTGEVKNIRPITITTYQILTYRKRKTDPFVHFDLFSASNWGLVIYDEVHLLPAPVFRVTAEIQARRRLGLTATLIREDHKEDEVFSLIGPKKYDVPWKVLEKQGWIATAHCIEVRVPLNEEIKYNYLAAGAREKFRIASENSEKVRVVKALLEKHEGDQVLIIGQYLDQLKLLAKYLNVPLITGKMPTRDRAVFYDQFRKAEIKVLMVSKVGNFAIDLPDANVAIQISGTFGSRQEEAQRLGRILRPKTGGQKAFFYSLVTRDSREEVFANNRQLFLTEQGYTYEIKDVTQIDGLVQG